MALTLLEVLKRNPDPITAAVISEFAEGDIMANIPFKDIKGSGEHYNREHTLPGVGFRGLNESYDESTGVINPESEPLRIAGGDLDVDVALVRMKGESERTIQERMKVKALRLAWEHAFIKGDSAADPRQFDGLQKRVTGSKTRAIFFLRRSGMVSVSGMYQANRHPGRSEAELRDPS